MAAIVLLSLNRSAQRSTRRSFISHLKEAASAGDIDSVNPSLRRLTLLPGARWNSSETGVRFMSHGTAARPAPRAGRRALLLVGAAAAVAGLVANGRHFFRAEMASRIPQVADLEEEGDILERCKKFMSPPVTDVALLQQKKQEMGTRMEMLIMQTQAEFCRALEEVDGGTFKVDRWKREEGK